MAIQEYKNTEIIDNVESFIPYVEKMLLILKSVKKELGNGADDNTVFKEDFMALKCLSIMHDNYVNFIGENCGVGIDMGQMEQDVRNGNLEQYKDYTPKHT